VDTGDGEVEGGGDQAGEGEEVVDTGVEGDVAPCITAAPGESPFAGEEGVEEEAPFVPSACPSAHGGGIMCGKAYLLNSNISNGSIPL
jgi:hypothetical protein